LTDENTPDRLKRLGERLDRARRRRQAAAPDRGPEDGDTNILRVALGLGLRIGLELVVALAVGTGIGWFIDQALGTRPWVMVGGFILGAATGILNVWRAMTGQGQAVGYRTGEDKKD
jgi:ATP synthase protein I